MSWYQKFTIPELKHMLKNRRLRRSGIKKQLIARLDADDISRPFRFLELPPELRNHIYGLVASEKGICKRRNVTWEDIRRVNFMESSLFRACRSIRNEGLIIYYQQRRFEIIFTGWECAMYFVSWLDRIGEVGRQNIRHLRLSFLVNQVSPPIARLNFLKHICTMLSDEATMVCSGDVHDMWWIGKKIISRNPTKKIQARFQSKTYDLAEAVTLYRKGQLDLNDWSDASLEFCPGMSWFGHGT